MVSDNTATIFELDPHPELDRTVGPRIFVCQGSSISEHRLTGNQVMGSPVEGMEPEISIENRFVSRRHGIFETNKKHTTFLAENSTNGTLYNGKLLDPGERVVLSDGDELLIPAGDERDGGDGFVLLVYAATYSRIKLWRGFRKQSADQLTGICKRDRFISWWEKNYWKNDYSQGILFILDLDDFKLINDTYGHNAGDQVLKHVADQLRLCVRYEDQICRWGGDEFVGIIPGDPSHIEERLNKLLERIEHHEISSCPPIHASLGYTFAKYASNPVSVAELVGMADKALYHIKNKGKSGICLYRKA
jgi:diguanylate cyclase (GGDEF)-like protein